MNYHQQITRFYLCCKLNNYILKFYLRCKLNNHTLEYNLRSGVCIAMQCPMSKVNVVDVINVSA